MVCGRSAFGHASPSHPGGCAPALRLKLLVKEFCSSHQVLWEQAPLLDNLLQPFIDLRVSLDIQRHTYIKSQIREELLPDEGQLLLAVAAYLAATRISTFFDE